MPDPVLVDVDIANHALGRIGAAPIQALDEDTDLAGQVAAVYNDVLDAAHAVYQWRWAQRTGPLDALAPPIGAVYSGLGWYFPQAATVGAFNGWFAAFSFPRDALGPPLGLYRRWPAETLREFRVEGQIVYTQAGPVFGSFVRRLSPDQWPPGFRIAVATWLAAELAVPVTHDKDLAASLRQDALGSPAQAMQGGLMGRAIALDGATGGSIVSAVQDDVLTRARYTGTGGWWGD